MPRCCVALGCSTETGERYSLHEFPINDGQTCAKWMRAVQQKLRNWQEPTASSSMLYESLSALWKLWRYLKYKLLKPGAIPIILPKSIDDDNGTSPSPPNRPASTKISK